MKDFIWTDYDDELEYDMFNDAEIVFSRFQPGSVYLMSCNRFLKDSTIVSFQEKFGEIAPIDISEKDLTGEFFPMLLRRMFTNKINDFLIQRNLALPDEQKLEFRQLFFFTYQDGAPMFSFGGLLDYKKSDFTLEKFNLPIFEFIKTGEERFSINPPNLTYKEASLLNSHLPNSEQDFIGIQELDFIPLSDRNKYRKLYKFLPSYMDVIT